MAEGATLSAARWNGAAGPAPRFGLGRLALYAALTLMAGVFLLPVYVMVVNSFKPLDEIRSGSLMALPLTWTVEPWLTAWSTAQVGVQPTGLKPYFINSFLLVVPAVGDGPYTKGWIRPLNRALYPPRFQWQSPDTARGVPLPGPPSKASSFS